MYHPMFPSWHMGTIWEQLTHCPLAYLLISSVFACPIVNLDKMSYAFLSSFITKSSATIEG